MQSVPMDTLIRLLDIGSQNLSILEKVSETLISTPNKKLERYFSSFESRPSVSETMKSNDGRSMAQKNISVMTNEWDYGYKEAC